MHIIGGEDTKSVRLSQTIQTVDTGPIITLIQIADSDVAQTGQGTR